MGEYGIMETSIWAPEKQTKAKMFDKSGTIAPMNLMYLDVPHMYNKTKVGMDLMYTLAKVEEANIALFQNKSV